MIIRVVIVFPIKMIKNRAPNTGTCANLVFKLISIFLIHYMKKYLPSRFRIITELIQEICIVELPEVSAHKEREEEAESPPHPGMKTVNRNVHVVAFAQRPQPIQTPSLIPELEEL